VVCDLVPTDDHTRFGQTWVDQLVAHADHDLPAGPARWVRLAVGLVATNTSSATPSWRPSNGSAAVSGPTVTATLSAGLPRSIGAHAPSYFTTASSPWSGSATSPGNQQPKGIRTGSNDLVRDSRG
jgi:hypothetical protein